MKPLTLVAIFLFLLAWSAEGQKNAHVIFKGTLIDSVQGIPVTNLPLDVIINSKNKTKISSDSIGNYQLEADLPRGNNIIYFNSASRNYNVDCAIEFVVQNDTIVETILPIKPSRLCWDSFLNDPLYFSKNQIELPMDSLQEMIKILKGNSTEYQDLFENRLINISVYCSYDEKRSIAKKRAKWIESVIINSGLNQNNYKIVVEAKEPLFICDYCDGCHYFYLKGKGHYLSEEQYNSLIDDKSKAYYLAQRRVITFKWEEKNLKN